MRTLIWFKFSSTGLRPVMDTGWKPVPLLNSRGRLFHITENRKPKTLFHPPTTITLVPTQLTMKLSGKATASFVRALKPVQ